MTDTEKRLAEIREREQAATTVLRDDFLIVYGERLLSRDIARSIADLLDDMLSEIDRLTAENAELNEWKSGKKGVEDYLEVAYNLNQRNGELITANKKNAKLTAELAEYQAWEMTPNEYRESVNFLLRMNKAIKQATGKTALDWEKLTAENALLTGQLSSADGYISLIEEACRKGHYGGIDVIIEEYRSIEQLVEESE